MRPEVSPSESRKCFSNCPAKIRNTIPTRLSIGFKGHEERNIDTVIKNIKETWPRAPCLGHFKCFGWNRRHGTFGGKHIEAFALLQSTNGSLLLIRSLLEKRFHHLVTKLRSLGETGRKVRGNALEAITVGFKVAE